MLYLLSLESYFNPRSHEGSDNGRFWSRAGSVYFNPRSHEGSDMRSEWMYITCSYFNPRSHEGSDETMRRSYAKDQRFQSTLPRGERPASKSTVNAITDFNPRSHEGSDVACFILHVVLVSISIHAPTRGATSLPHCHRIR